MAMGSTGMGDMMDMGQPRNTLPMGAGQGPHGSIFMGGMFTILKIREGLKSYDQDPGWYEHPAGTVATLAAVTAVTAVTGGRQAAAPTTILPARRPSRPGWAALGGDKAFEVIRAESCGQLPGRK